MLSYDIGSMALVLSDYENYQHTKPKDEAYTAQQKDIEQAMEQLVHSCVPALRELRTLLRACYRFNKMHQITEDLRILREQCFQDELHFDGSMTFLTQQPPVDMSAFSGPDLKANSWVEAQARANLLGLQVAGELRHRYPEHNEGKNATK